jgi:ABC-type amino acid transport system permease subunit
LTPAQTFTIAMLGGFAATLGLALVALIGAAVYAAVSHLFDLQQEWRGRRSYLRAVRDLPTAQPKDRR